MKFLDRPLGELTPEICAAELERAKEYVIDVRATKRLVETHAGLRNPGKADPPDAGEKDAE